MIENTCLEHWEPSSNCARCFQIRITDLESALAKSASREAALVEKLKVAVEEEREACAMAVLNEQVDADETQNREDRAYNMALLHAVEAIRNRAKIKEAS